MANEPYTQLGKVTEIGYSLLNSELETNLKWYLDWGFLGIGGYTNVNIPTSGAFGGTYDNMRLVTDPVYTDGQVWETARKDWVWETGTYYTGTDPIQISGVYVDGSYYATGDATYGHHYNYPLGRVVFNSAIPTTSTVQIEHSYRTVQTYVADQANWWDELQYNSHRVDDSTFSNTASGSWGILANHRVQLPAVVIEAVPRRRFTPYQLGDTSQFVRQDVLFHVVGESRWWRNQLVDILSYQIDQSIWLYDSNVLSDSGVYPLDSSGMRVTSPLNYDDVVDTSEYRYKLAKITNMNVVEMESRDPQLYLGTVRATFEVVLT